MWKQIGNDSTVQRLSSILLASVFATLVIPAAAEPANAANRLAEQLHSHAPLILQEMRNQKITNIGVLKFQLLTRTGVRRDVGTINRLIAERLETALILANSSDPQKQLQIVRDASSLANRMPSRPNHMNRSRNRELFTTPLPVAWGNKQVLVQAFVTGLIKLDADLKQMRVVLLSVTKDKPLRALANFPVKMDGAILNEVGESFQRRSPNDEIDPSQSALDVRRDAQANFPLQDRPLVNLSVYYDGKLIEESFTPEGDAVIPEPRKGEKVTMVLERMDNSDVVLGAVLRVNGDNSLYRQRFADFDCSKWILQKNSRIEIRGFQIDDQYIEQFKVLSDAESDNLEFYYGPKVGTISLVVFKERKERPELKGPGDAYVENSTNNSTKHSTNSTPKVSRSISTITTAKFPSESPIDLASLQRRLRRAADKNKRRGIITHGDRASHGVQTEHRNWEPSPLISAIIRYRPRPQSSP